VCTTNLVINEFHQLKDSRQLHNLSLSLETINICLTYCIHN